nr:hypothetical protein BaRGS_000001 [Batillaria attramentaria]
MCMDNEPEKYSVVVQNGKAGEMGLGGQGLLSEDQTDPLDDVNSTQAGGDSSQEMQEQENAGESDVEGAITNSEKKLAQGENAAATSKDAQMEKRLKRARRLTFSKKKLVLKTNVMRDQKKKAQYVLKTVLGNKRAQRAVNPSKFRLD